MCMKYTKYKYSRNLAWEILLKERVRQLPVEIIPICKHMDIRVLRYSDMPSLQFNAGGASAEIGGKMYIFYDDTAPKVRGRRSATPIAAESPGMQPTMTPMVTPITIMRRFIGSRALPKPWAISANVFASMSFPP